MTIFGMTTEVQKKMPRFEKCNHCKYGWNNPHGCNFPDPLDPCKVNLSCYQPMTEAQKFQQEAEHLYKSDKSSHTKLVGEIFSGYDIIDTANPIEMANYYASEYVKELKKTSVKQKKKVSSNAPSGMISAVELSQKLGISVTTIRMNCRKGLYPGAMKLNGKWHIPIFRFQYSRK